MTIREFAAGDTAAICRIWNESVDSGDSPVERIDEAKFAALYGRFVAALAAHIFVAEADGAPIGFAIGLNKLDFLPGESPETAPGYFSMLCVARNQRRRGVGRALLAALEAAFTSGGRRALVCASMSPVTLRWTVPGTPGHDHNNAPGVDVASPLYPFLIACGFKDTCREVAMYLNLADYRWDPKIDEIIARLRAEGIYVGRYDTKLGCDYDRVCDRVGSEYWRDALAKEIAKPNPRVILAAVHDGYIVGFTGIIEREASGRGYFTGICTDPEYEKRGIATALFNLLMREFIAVNADFSTLFTGVTNHAQRLYARTGFRVVKTFAVMKKAIGDM